METSVNNKCKAFTSLEQSKKLAEILPIESADMHWTKDFDGSWFVDLAEYTSVKIPKYVDKVEEHLLPCWSLAALLGVLPDYTLQTNTGGTVFVVCESKKPIISDAYDNPVDACYDMIIKLHELNLL